MKGAAEMNFIQSKPFRKNQNPKQTNRKRRAKSISGEDEPKKTSQNGFMKLNFGMLKALIKSNCRFLELNACKFHKSSSPQGRKE